MAFRNLSIRMSDEEIAALDEIAAVDSQATGKAPSRSWILRLALKSMVGGKIQEPSRRDPMAKTQKLDL